MVRKVRKFQTDSVKLTFKFLMALPNPDDMKTWSAETNDEAYQEYEQFSLGLEAVDRLAHSCGRVFLQEAWPLVQQCLNSQNWVSAV